MSAILPFCQAKLQYLLDLVLDQSLDDKAFRVAAYLALTHADHDTGECHPSFETIGAALGRHAKSVKRALYKPEITRHLTVVRGTNRATALLMTPCGAPRSGGGRGKILSARGDTSVRKRGTGTPPRTKKRNLNQERPLPRRICPRRGNPAQPRPAAPHNHRWPSFRRAYALRETGTIGWHRRGWPRLTEAYA
jgi:hypothetical protein